MQISLKAARVNANLTQSEVAKKLGVSEKSVSNWENGTNSIKISALMELAKIYGIEIADFSLPTGSQ